jgi:hypothetical protein
VVMFRSMLSGMTCAITLGGVPFGKGVEGRNELNLSIWRPPLFPIFSENYKCIPPYDDMMMSDRQTD